MTQWDSTVQFLSDNISKFEIKNKDESKFQRFLGKISFWSSDYVQVWTTLYPVVWRPSSDRISYKILQHEAVHLFDQETFFGLFPKSLKWLNVFLFVLVYASPQIFVLFSFLAFVNLWWLLCLLFLLPLPSPGRALAELRAYRRTVELGGDVEAIVEAYRDSSYYFMFPFPKLVRKMIKKPSPYQVQMDAIGKE